MKWEQEQTMPEALRVFLAGRLSSKWFNVEKKLGTADGQVCRLGGTAEEILSFCRHVSPCVLIADESFIDEASATGSWHALELNRSLHVLVEAEHPSFSRTEHLIRIGCAGVLNRKLRPAQLVRAVRAVLNGELWAERKTVAAILRNVLDDTRCGLTTREAEILGLLAEGLKNQQIAERLFISPQTVRWHLRMLYGKLGTHDRLSAITRVPPGWEPGRVGVSGHRTGT